MAGASIEDAEGGRVPVASWVRDGLAWRIHGVEKCKNAHFLTESWAEKLGRKPRAVPVSLTEIVGVAGH